MNVNISNAKVGQEVILLPSNRFGDSRVNPTWGGSQGKVKGKVAAVVPNQFVIVDWENGIRNHYDDNCLATVPTTTFKELVESVVNTQFIANNQPFSAYDVTTRVRKEVNEGRAEIDGRGYEDVNGINTQKVTHDEVRTVVRDFMNNVSAYDRRFNGDYIVYTPNGTVTTPAISTSAPAATPASSTVALTFTPKGPVSSGTSTATANNPVETAKLVAYIASKGSRTLKQIQSRFKVEGGAQPTVREIAGAVSAAGLRIDTKTPYYASVVTR